MFGMIGFISLFVFFVAVSDAAKILVLFTLPGKSHIGAYQPLAEELARRGHQVTVVTAFPRKAPLANYTEIIYQDTFPPRDSAAMNLFDYGKSNFIMTMIFTEKMFYGSCEKLVSQPAIQKLIHSDDLQFDLVMFAPIGTYCFYGILHKIGAPYIQLIPNTLVPWHENSVGNPNTISYIPEMTMETESRDFQARLISVLQNCFTIIFKDFYMMPNMDSLMKQYFPLADLPTVSEISSKTSFLFLHSHPLINFPRPLTPNTIEVAGLHIKDTNKLPQDLQTYLDEASHGVIYFSLGSNVRGIDMPETMLNGILKSFSKLKQNVLWKWEADSLPGQPKNVRLGKWLPQHAILAHPNVKVFITHGGVMSIQEATYFGVPLIAVPVMGDQKFNARHAESNGYAVVVEVQNITEKSLDWALHEVLHESRYRENAKRASSIFRDQPQSPLDRAVFWTEYAIRHRGASHLRSAALELNFFQYYLLDVIAALLLAVFTAVGCTVLVGRAVVRRLFLKSAALSKKKKN